MTVPGVEQPSLLNLALLLGDHTLAFVQPLLVLPPAAAAEMQQLWVAAAECAARQQDKQTSANLLPSQQGGAAEAGMPEAWRQVMAPLIMDLEYLATCGAAPAAPAGLAARFTMQPPSVAGQAAPRPSQAVMPEAEPGAAGSADKGMTRRSAWGVCSAAGGKEQELLRHVVGFLVRANMSATITYICSATAAAAGATSNSTNHAQLLQQQQRAAQAAADAAVNSSLQAAADAAVSTSKAAVTGSDSSMASTHTPAREHGSAVQQQQAAAGALLQLLRMLLNGFAQLAPSQSARVSSFQPP